MELWIRKVQACLAAVVSVLRADSHGFCHVTSLGKSAFAVWGFKFWDVQAGVYRWHEIMKSLDQRVQCQEKTALKPRLGILWDYPIWSWHLYHRVPLNCSTSELEMLFSSCQCAAVQRTSAVWYQNMFSSHLFQQKAITLTWASFFIDWDSMI